MIGCGNFDSQEDADCEGGKCDGQGEFARGIVTPKNPLALSNPQQERVTWPVWGSAFDIDETVKARIALAPTGQAGLVFALPGDPEERRAFEMQYTGTEWKLAETVGGGAPLQQVSLGKTLASPIVVEVSNTGRTIKVRSGGRLRGSLTSKEAAAPEGPMGIYVQLEPGAQLAIDDLAITQPMPGAPELGTPLKALANARGRSLGSTSETGEWPPRHDLAFESMYAGQFDTAGILDFYWTTTRGEDPDFYFLPADMMVNYATVRGQTINGYFLVWDEELPEWVGQLAESEGAAGLGAMLDKHIETIVTRYRGRVKSWIVANESFLGPDENGTASADYADNVWYGTLGPDYIARAFRVADQFDPTATLIYNETGAEAEGPKSDFLYARMAELKQGGVPIDAVGLQFHIDAASPPDMASVKRNMERLGALGLDVLITELDVNLANLPGTHDERLKKQADLFAAVAQTCLAVPACKTITLFGFSDKHAWDELGPEVCKTSGSTGLCSEPLILDREYQPKPAYQSFRSTLEY
ncbi:MAG TPA: endo-1,4-beta-xylanase [Kofleriaceae bacterium]|nr:endo-1,4-beta-xylanase [Kofleriaceae bacterium]